MKRITLTIFTFAILTLFLIPFTLAVPPTETAWFEFESNLSDSGSIQFNASVFEGAETYNTTDQILGTASFQLTGDDAIHIEPDGNTMSARDSWSICWWQRFEDVSGGDIVFSQDPSDADPPNRGIAIESVSTFNFIEYQNNTETSNLIAITGSLIFRNIHVCYVYDNTNTNLTVYVNNSVLNSAIFNFDNDPIDPAEPNWTFGAGQGESGSASGFINNGLLDDLRWFDGYNMSVSDVNFLYASGSGTTEPLSNNVVDVTPPSISGETEFPTDPATYVQGATYEFNATITDAGGLDTVLIEFNGVNQTPTSSGNVFTFTVTDLGVAVHNYIWYANDTSGNPAVSELETYTINQATSTCSISATDTEVTLPTQVNVTASCTNTESTLELFRDQVDVTGENGVLTTLAAGEFEYFANITSSQNFSAATSALLNITVNPAPTALEGICTEGQESFANSVAFVGLTLLLIFVVGIVGLLLLTAVGKFDPSAVTMTPVQIIFGVIGILVLSIVVALGGFIMGDGFCLALT